MVTCTCTVEPIDRHCDNTPQYCYRCCTESTVIKTCRHHFHQMGNTAANARLASGLVHPSITGVVTVATSQPPVAAGEVGPGSASDQQHAGSDSPVPGVQQPAARPSADAVAATQLPAQRVSLAAVAAPGNVASASALAAMRAELDSVRAAAQASAAALQTRLEQQSRTMELILARLPAAPSTQPSPPVTEVAGQAAAPSAAVPRPSPHRRVVLDRAAPAVASDNQYNALHDSDSDDDAHEVTPQTHTLAQPASVLPAAFRPVPSGTEQGAQQQLAAILSGLGKGTKVKYATFAELDEALDDWVADGKKAGWSSQDVDAIRTYQRLLIDGFPHSERWSLRDVLEYHRRWCRAVDAKTIDPFAQGAALNLTLVYEVSHPRQYGATAASTTPRRGGRFKDTAPAANGAKSGGSLAINRHPAGSCTNHPSSTTHNTAECKKK